jgi:hypothetical protein
VRACELRPPPSRRAVMELQIKGRNLEVSETMRTFAERKLA